MSFMEEQKRHNIELKRDNNAQNEKIATQDNTIATLNGRIATQDNTIATLNGRISTQDNTIATLNGTIVSLKGRILFLESENESISLAVDDERQQFTSVADSKVTAASSKVTAASSKVTEAETNAKVAERKLNFHKSIIMTSKVVENLFGQLKKDMAPESSSLEAYMKESQAKKDQVYARFAELADLTVEKAIPHFDAFRDFKLARNDYIHDDLGQIEKDVFDAAETIRDEKSCGELKEVNEIRLSAVDAERLLIGLHECKHAFNRFGIFN